MSKPDVSLNMPDQISQIMAMGETAKMASKWDDDGGRRPRAGLKPWSPWCGKWPCISIASFKPSDSSNHFTRPATSIHAHARAHSHTQTRPEYILDATCSQDYLSGSICQASLPSALQLIYRGSTWSDPFYWEMRTRQWVGFQGIWKKNLPQSDYNWQLKCL